MPRAPTPPKTASPSAWQAEPPPGGPTGGCTRSLTRLPAMSVLPHPCALTLAGMCYSQDDLPTSHPPQPETAPGRAHGPGAHGHTQPPTHTWAHPCPGYTCTHTHIHVPAHVLAHLYPHVHVHLHTHAHTCLHTCPHTCLHTCLQCTHVPTHVLSHMSPHTCLHTPTHVPAHMMTHVPAHTRTHTRVCRWHWPSSPHQKPCVDFHTDAHRCTPPCVHRCTHTTLSHSLSCAHVGRQVYTCPSVRTGTWASRGDKGEEAKRGGTKGTGREGGTAHPHAGLPGAGLVLLGLQGRCMAGAGRGAARGAPDGLVGIGTDRVPFLPSVTFSESTAPQLGAPAARPPVPSAPAPSPARAAVFASSRYVPVCTRAEEVVWLL